METDMISHNGDSINNNYGIRNFKNRPKTDGGLTKITNTGKNDKNNNTGNINSSSSKKRIDKLTTTRRHSTKKEIKMKIRRKQKNHLETISQVEEEKEKGIRKVLFEIEQEIKFYQDGEAEAKAEGYRQQQ